MVSNGNPVHPKYMYLDRLDRANSVNPDQTAPQLLAIQFTTFDMYSKPVLSSHSKRDKTKVLKPCSTLMQVKSTAECSTGAFCITFDLHEAIICHQNLFLVFF